MKRGSRKVEKSIKDNLKNKKTKYQEPEVIYRKRGRNWNQTILSKAKL